MREGSLEPPTRRPIPWQDPDFYDEHLLDAELRRVFDICHGCRRCFNLCDSFPKLFDLVDAAKSGELDTVDSKDFGGVVDACTLCDMCFMTKCPYVPPHSFDLDFPHLMLRARAVQAKRDGVGTAERMLGNTDLVGKLAGLAAPLANWANATGNKVTRPLIEAQLGLHREADLPKMHFQTFEQKALAAPPVNTAAPAYGRRAVLYATCFVNYNDPAVGVATQAVLHQNGVQTQVVYPKCCGMPLLEQGDIAGVAANAREVAAMLLPYAEAGWDIIALVPSCALMLKFEWPLILPEDAQVKALARATFDVSEYVVDIARKEGIAPGLQALDSGVALHIACHARAQNMGQKGADLLRLIPGADIQVIERCSGHGGAWGYRTENFDTALKVGRPVARSVNSGGKRTLSSECPLAGVHIRQGAQRLAPTAEPPELITHPIQLLARAYGL